MTIQRKIKENGTMPRDKAYYENKLKELELKDAVKTARDALKKFREKGKK